MATHAEHSASITVPDELPERLRAHSIPTPAPLRIALLAAALSPNTKSWVEGLRASGAIVDVITFHPDDPPGEGVHALRHVARFGKVGFVLGVPRVRALLGKLRPDLVIGYYLSSYGLVAALAAKGTLVTAPAGSEILRRGDHLTRLVQRYVVLKSHLIVVWAKHMVQPLCGLGVPQAKLLVLPRGIDQAVFSPARATHDAGGPARVVWTRSLKTVYDPETSVKAVKLLVDRSYDIHFHILGDGPLEEPIRALVRRLGLEHRIHFEGRVPAHTVASFLRKADVYLATAHSDGASASLFEAMACGAFPVVTNIPANREWIEHGINGLLFRAGDVEATAEAIAHALGSPRLRAQAADANGLIAREHLILKRNVGLMVDRFLELRSGQRPPVPE